MYYWPHDPDCKPCCSYRYKDILVSMMDAVLKKVQLHFNIDELREIDNDAIDDDVRVMSSVIIWKREGDNFPPSLERDGVAELPAAESGIYWEGGGIVSPGGLSAVASSSRGLFPGLPQSWTDHIRTGSRSVH